MKKLIWVIVINVFVYFLHEYSFRTLEIPSYLPLLKTYLVNTISTLVICTAIFFLKRKFMESIGFIFMGFSFFKMIVFFLIINPRNPVTSSTDKNDALIFFIPYVINMILEIKYLKKILEK